jgi:Arc/MetJ-type ribon-helix-helix transcriptional regulator
MSDATAPIPEPATSRSRGRPKSRYADRDEQVRQNMRLYRARRQAEQHALQRALETLLLAVERGDLHQTFAAGAAVAGIWKESAQRMRQRKRERHSS